MATAVGKGSTMVAKKARNTSTAAQERCDLCGARVGVESRSRWRHLRSEHRVYANGLLLRLLAPLGFVAVIAVLSVLHASVGFMLGALAVCAAVVGFGVVQAGSVKRASGSPSSLKVRSLVREGGFRFLLLGFVFVSLLILALRG